MSMFLSTTKSLICSVLSTMDLAFRRQKFSEFVAIDEEFNGCRLIDTKLFTLDPTYNFTLEGL